MQKLLKILEERLTGQKGHYTLILLDIDFFLRYRLRFSSAACDQMLEQIRRFLPKAAEPAVQGARFIEAGGDEFALLLPSADLEKGVGAAGRNSPGLSPPSIYRRAAGGISVSSNKLQRRSG